MPVQLQKVLSEPWAAPAAAAAAGLRNAHSEPAQVGSGK